MNKTHLILGLLLIGAFSAFGVSAFNSDLAPYVSFKRAAELDGRVEVKGVPFFQGARYDLHDKMFRFDMRDDSGTVMTVEYNQSKPSNFDEAKSVVAVGRVSKGVFLADELLVKCPDKYQSAAQSPVEGGPAARAPYSGRRPTIGGKV